MARWSSSGVSRRQLVKLVAGCSAGAALAACAKPVEVTKVETVAVEQTVVVKETVVQSLEPAWEQGQLETLWCCARPEDVPNYEKINALFEENYPGTKVHMQLLPAGQNFFEKLNTQLAAGTPPDVFDMWEGYVQPYAARGALLNLDPLFAADDKVQLEDLLPTARDAGSWGGNVYAFGVGVMPGPVSLYYNPDHFDEAGMRYPDSDWTWDDMRDAAKQLTIDKDGDGEPEQWGLTFENWFVPWLYWIWSNGGDVFNEDETQCTLTDPKAVEALQYWADLIHKDKVAISSTMLETLQGELNAFITGAVSMYLGNSWDVTTLTTAAEQGCKWKAVLAPTANNGQRSWYLHFGCLSIAKLSKMPEAAWRYIRDFALNYEVFGQPTMPGLRQLLYTFATERNHELGYDPLLALANQPGVMRVPGAGERWDKISTLIQGEFDLLFLGQKTAEETTATACALVDEELSRSE